MKAAHSLYAGSSFQVGSVGSLRYCVDRIPFELSKPAGLRTAPTEFDTLFSRCTGFHSISAAFLIAWAANFGVVTLKKTSAPDALRLIFWESIVGSVVSYGSSAMIGILPFSPSLSPLT